MGVLELKTKVFSEVSLRWQQHSGFKKKDTDTGKIKEENLEQTGNKEAGRELGRKISIFQKSRTGDEVAFINKCV